MFKLLSHKVYFFGAFLFLLLSGFGLLLAAGKLQCFLVLNSFHRPWLDIFFYCTSFLGDGLFSLLIAAIIWFFWKQKQLAFHILVAYLISGIAAQILKRIFVAARPKEIIGPEVYNKFIEGIGGLGWDSFPSGHTTSIFALATLFCFYTDKKMPGLLALLIATIVGYSRIYLGQHFLQDVLGGSVLGTCTAVLVYFFLPIPPAFIKKNKQQKIINQQNQDYSSGFAGN
jgi:membrane-associated phospholipid phosphatase